MKTKKELREYYLFRRLNLSEASYNRDCQLMISRFMQEISDPALSTIHLFIPLRPKREFDTYLLMEEIRKEYPNTRFVVPKTSFEDFSMSHFAMDDALKLSTGKHGLTEPIDGNTVDVAEIDLVVTPLIIADQKGFRLGYGKGFYDRFLSQLPKSTYRVGFSFFDPVPELPVDQYDVPLTHLITPSQLFTFAV